MAAAKEIPSALRAATTEAIVGLLACTGMRVGEALALDRGDVDLPEGLLTIRRAKFNKTREIPLHPTATASLADYAKRRDRLTPRAAEPAFFVSAAGTRVLYCNFHLAFQDLVRRAGIEARSASCRPRPHDLRHSFAVATLARWYREGADVAGQPPVALDLPGPRRPGRHVLVLVRVARTACPGGQTPRGDLRGGAMSALAPTLQAFFTERLIGQRRASPNTVAAYRDTFRLLLCVRGGKDGHGTVGAAPRGSRCTAGRIVPRPFGD